MFSPFARTLRSCGGANLEKERGLRRCQISSAEPACKLAYSVMQHAERSKDGRGSKALFGKKNLGL